MTEAHNTRIDQIQSLRTPILPHKRRYKLIACEIVYRELCLLTAQTEHIVDMEFMRKGLHDAGKETMLQTLQDAINKVDTSIYDAILLGYGRCNDGVAGIQAPAIPLVIPRAHDCITFFFGSRGDYEKFFSQNPGTYFRTSGWTERSESGDDSLMNQLGLNRTYEQYVEKYGKDNAQFIMQTLGSWQENYKALAYIDMGLSVDDEYARLAQVEAQQRNLQFHHLKGNLRLLQALVTGHWHPDDFLVVPPGATLTSNNDGDILSCVS